MNNFHILLSIIIFKSIHTSTLYRCFRMHRQQRALDLRWLGIIRVYRLIGIVRKEKGNIRRLRLLRQASSIRDIFLHASQDYYYCRQVWYNSILVYKSFPLFTKKIVPSNIHPTLFSQFGLYNPELITIISAIKNELNK